MLVYSLAQDLTNSNTEYSPLPNTEPIQFYQPNYTLKLLQGVLKANEAVLKTLKLSGSYGNLPNLPENANLADLASSVRDTDQAWVVFQTLWNELTTIPGRPPVLLTLDGLSHIMKVSAYRDPSFNLVHSHDLTLVRLFIDALSGNISSLNGLAVVAATSRSNSPRSPSMELALDQAEARAAGKQEPSADPYGKKYDHRVYNAVNQVQTLRVKGITKPEARAILEYWAASGLLRAVVNDATVADKWTTGGGGVIGEIERASLLSMRM
jgi:small subunit ribosomal protein S29